MRSIVFFLLTALSLDAAAQALMYIHRTGQPLVQFQINEIDSITYSAVGDPGVLPLVTTAPLGAYSSTTATLGGSVSSNGGTQITARGVAWNLTGSPTTSDNITSDGVGTGTFESLLDGLIANTTYYARAYATNNAGTAYGNEVEFFVTADSYIPANGVTDIDGNFYETILVSNGQEWMAENLKACRYANGDSILHLDVSFDWANTNDGAWAIINNNPNHLETFGKLYNGWAVSDPRNVCPDGWHVPTNDEWTLFHSVNGGMSYGGGAMKVTGTTLWLSPNTGATNASGFTGLPGGRRLSGGDFQEIYGAGFWWTSSGNSATLNNRVLYYSSNGVWAGTLGKGEGLSVRCIKD